MSIDVSFDSASNHEIHLQTDHYLLMDESQIYDVIQQLQDDFEKSYESNKEIALTLFAQIRKDIHRATIGDLSHRMNHLNALQLMRDLVMLEVLYPEIHNKFSEDMEIFLGMLDENRNEGAVPNMLFDTIDYLMGEHPQVQNNVIVQQNFEQFKEMVVPYML